MQIIDRNRADFRWLQGDYSFRYRNRIRLERDTAVRKYDFVPYGTAEFFYNTRYDMFNRNRFIVGVEMPITPRAMVDTYVARQNDSRSSPEHVNALGVALNLSF
jgi:hypothetical protein